MMPISAPVAGPSYFSQGEGMPLPLHYSIEELVDWCSSELHVSPHLIGMWSQWFGSD